MGEHDSSSPDEGNAEKLPGAGLKRVTVRKKSKLSRQLNEMDLDPNALERWLASPRAERPFLRDAFPHLSADEREFFLSGSTPAEWDNYLGRGF